MLTFQLAVACTCIISLSCAVAGLCGQLSVHDEIQTSTAADCMMDPLFSLMLSERSGLVWFQPSKVEDHPKWLNLMMPIMWRAGVQHLHGDTIIACASCHHS